MFIDYKILSDVDYQKIGYISIQCNTTFYRKLVSITCQGYLADSKRLVVVCLTELLGTHTALLYFISVGCQAVDFSSMQQWSVVW